MIRVVQEDWENQIEEKCLFKSCLQMALVIMHGVLIFAQFVTS